MNLSYHAFESPLHGINACDRESNDYPLIVNCAGRSEISFPFATHNKTGRSDIYLMYIAGGELQIGDAAVGAGTLVIFGAKYPYRYSHTSTDDVVYLWAHFTGSYAERLLVDLGFSKTPFIKKLPSDNLLESRFRSLFERFEGKSVFERQELSCALERILLEAARSAVGEKRGESLLGTSLRYIHDHYNSEIRIPELAKMENLSNSRYVARFTSAVGMSPMQYIVELRLRYACDLLENTDMSIKEVASLSGYDDPHFFSKLFKKHIGLSPSEHRK